MLVGIGMSRGELVPPRAVIRQVRRRWPVEQKRRIVEATYAPGASIAQVAREHGVNANQLHSWRRLYQAGRFEAQSQAATLLPVRMIEEPTRVIAQPAAKPRRTHTVGLLELDTPRGRLHIQGAIDPCTLRIVLESLLG
jgi:transposase